MIFRETRFPEAWLIEPSVIQDDRGWFMRTFCRKTFAERGLISDFVQANHSLCIHAGTLRGLHYQVSPFAEVKLTRCIKGAVFDVLVDMRRKSPNFLCWHGEVLSAENRRMIYIPLGFAHGYQAIEAGSEVVYQASSNYAPDSERCLRFDDPRVGIDWPIKIPILSDKDRSTPFLSSDFEGIEL